MAQLTMLTVLGAAVLALNVAGPAKMTENLPSEPIVTAAQREAFHRELRRKNLLMPVAGTNPEVLKGSFYQGRGERQHNAADIIAPRGTPVLAVEDGIIRRLFNSEAGGITIYQMDLSGHYVYYYAHLDAYAPGLTQGNKVRKGDVIGYVGSTGNANPEAPHLHFAIWQTTADKVWSGIPIDPYEVFAGTTQKQPSLKQTPQPRQATTSPAPRQKSGSRMQKLELGIWI
jgi:peptidoglycan LD-endopeptidase LytH